MSILANLKSILTGGPPIPPPVVDLEGVSTWRLEKSLAAGRELQEVRDQFAAEGRTAIDVVTNGNQFEYWQMYPWQGGILDQRNHSQYFYHTHEDYKGEHGHFHTFYYQQRKLAHLVAIGMDAGGRINQLYTFNRWGPGDHYYPATKLKSLLPRFRIGAHNDLDARLHRFVSCALALFQPEIEHLFDERDATFDRYRAEHNGESPYEDRDLEITSALPVDVDFQVSRLASELERRGEPAGSTDGGTDGMLPAPTKGNGAGRVESTSGEGDAAQPDLEALSEAVQVLPLEERPTEQIRRGYQAGLALRKIDAGLKEQGRTLLEAVMNGQEYEYWAMYPWDNGVIDEKTRSQYFYNAHPQSPEHGHFHIFYTHSKQLVHLAALSLDNGGEAMELFTVNRWVTGDFYLPPAKLKPLLKQYRITTDTFDKEVNTYVNNILILYQPEIAALIEQRERVFVQYRKAHNGRQPYEDRGLDVTSSLAVKVEEQTARLEAELDRRGESLEEMDK